MIKKLVKEDEQLPDKHILVVDDESTIREVLRRYLERDGYLVSEASTGEQAVELVSEIAPDLVVLDLMLPGMSGLEAAEHMQALADIPILMLTARGALDDRITGLERGADDYVVKPFSPREVLLRIQAILRRSDEVAGGSNEVIEHGDLRLDPGERVVYREREKLSLTAKEFDLLHFLMRNPRQVFSRDQLMDQVWGYEYYGDPSTVTVHIRRLREKVEYQPSDPDRILTVWGVGYKYEAMDDE